MSFTCPRCWRTSYHPDDEQYGYCGNCHDFTGAIHGNQRHSGGSTTAGSEREMRMQPNDEEPKAKPDMPEVPRNGISRSLRDVLWERMEPQGEPPLRSVPGSGIPRTLLTPPKGYRYTLTNYDSTALVICGVMTGLAIANSLHYRLSRGHAVIVVAILIILCTIYVVTHLVIAMRQLKKDRKEMTEMLKKAQAELHDAIGQMDYWKEK